MMDDGGDDGGDDVGDDDDGGGDDGGGDDGGGDDGGDVGDNGGVRINLSLLPLLDGALEQPLPPLAILVNNVKDN